MTSRTAASKSKLLYRPRIEPLGLSSQCFSARPTVRQLVRQNEPQEASPKEPRQRENDTMELLTMGVKLKLCEQQLQKCRAQLKNSYRTIASLVKMTDILKFFNLRSGVIIDQMNIFRKQSGPLYSSLFFDGNLALKDSIEEEDLDPIIQYCNKMLRQLTQADVDLYLLQIEELKLKNKDIREGYEATILKLNDRIKKLEKSETLHQQFTTAVDCFDRLNRGSPEMGKEERLECERTIKRCVQLKNEILAQRMQEIKCTEIGQPEEEQKAEEERYSLTDLFDIEKGLLADRKSEFFNAFFSIAGLPPAPLDVEHIDSIQLSPKPAVTEVFLEAEKPVVVANLERERQLSEKLNLLKNELKNSNLRVAELQSKLYEKHRSIESSLRRDADLNTKLNEIKEQLGILKQKFLFNSEIRLPPRDADEEESKAKFQEQTSFLRHLYSRSEELFRKEEGLLKGLYSQAVNHIFILENELEDESKQHSFLQGIMKLIRMDIYNFKNKVDSASKEARRINRSRAKTACTGCNDLASSLVRLCDLITEDVEKVEASFCKINRNKQDLIKKDMLVKQQSRRERAEEGEADAPKL